MFRVEQYVQVVGHTPMEAVSRSGNIISCDVFSTAPDGNSYGSEIFPVIDTVSGGIVATFDGKTGSEKPPAG